MKSYQNSILSILQVITENHPEVMNLLIEKRRLDLSNDISRVFNHTVQYGPFKGLRFPQESHWGLRDRASMIFSMYEQEILRIIENLPNKYTKFIDLGAADGYYGVGVLVNKIFEKSYCFEITNEGQEVIKKNAELNNVIDKISIHGKAESDFYLQIPESEIKESVLMVDIEGAEFDVLTEIVFEKFSNSVIIIELHDWFFNDQQDKLNGLLTRAGNTHKIHEITMSDRNPGNYKELNLLSDNDRWLICSEGRGQLMTWLKLDPLYTN